MAATALQRNLQSKLPVLFAYIGWADRYDGTEPVRGNHGWLKQNPDDSNKSSESRAFIRDKNGRYVCGVGRGRDAPSPLHVVLVARDPTDGRRKAVGVYAAARMVDVNLWSVAHAREAKRFALGERPTIEAWAGDTGMRRWAWRGGAPGREYPELMRAFRRIVMHCGATKRRRMTGAFDDQTYADLDALEGRLQLRLVRHRRREARLRREKIAERIDREGRLQCEVPGCGFDFLKRYGELGRGYAQVHHLRPLGVNGEDRKGVRTTLRDLAIVCANCHAMIHRGANVASCERFSSEPS